jgi:hypothetical protein
MEDKSYLLTKKVYVQCELEREGPYSTTIKEVAWIPKELAKVGTPLKIMHLRGDWIDGWKVVSVGAQAPIPDVQKSIRTHRKRTGDALPEHVKDNS